MKLKDQVAIVTGAGRNIGEEVAKLFAAEGAKIAVVDLDRTRGQRTVDAIKAAGGDAAPFVTDVSKGADVAALVKDVVARFGKHRHSRQQRRDLRQQVDPRSHRRGLGPRDECLAQEPVPDDEVCRAADGRARRRRPHRQCRLDLGLAGPSARDRLFGRQGARSRTSPAPPRCNSRRTTSASTRSCRTRSARRSGATSSIRAAGAEHAQARRPAG